jgi:DNA (cytosine-5)-methyltransferase 1
VTSEFLRVERINDSEVCFLIAINNKRGRNGRVNRTDKNGILSVNGKNIIPHDEALRLLMAAECTGNHSDLVRGELAAIISHWLQSPSEAPILLQQSHSKKWINILRNWSLLANRSPAASLTAEKNDASPVKIDFSKIPFPPVGKPKFTFIDLFAGIGGFRIALQNLGGKCVFSSEWNQQAKETYFKNYGEVPFGDIKQFTAPAAKKVSLVSAIPCPDIITGGFPCQAFSQAGKQLGFKDARGTLFFDILEMTKALRPKALILENVKRLRGHDGGKTFAVIANSLRELDYKVYSKVLRASDFGLPQNRERIFIVAFDKALHFDFPDQMNLPTRVADILEEKVDDLFTITDRIYEGHKRRVREHRARGNGFGFSVFKPEVPYTNTISARYWKDGSEILIDQGETNPRMLTPRECARLQGFKDEFRPHQSRRHAYQQFGNSVPVPVVQKVAEKVFIALHEKLAPKSLLDPLEIVTL